MFSWLIKVEELSIETLVDLPIPVKPTMELVQSLTTMRTSLSLRLPDVYDSLQIFLQERITWDWCLNIWVSFQWSWIALLYCTYLVWTTVNCSRFVTEVSSPSTPWFIHDISVLILRSSLWPDWGCVMRFDRLCLSYTYHYIHRGWMFSSRGEWWGIQAVQI